MKDLQQLTGINSAMAATYAERFILDPDDVPEGWKAFFSGMEREQLAELVGWELVAAWEARQQVRQGHIPTNGASNGHAAAALGSDEGWRQAEQLRIDWAVRELIEVYRRHGHRHADINPLLSGQRNGQVHFDLERFGLSTSDLDRLAYTGDLPLPERAPVREVIAALEATYCNRIGFEVYHVESDEERQWLLNAIETTSGQVQLSPEEERLLLEKVSSASLLEEFLHRKFLGAKRFSVEGAESLIPMLHIMVEASGRLGVREIVLGMAHRGRLNVMINLFDKKLEDLFTIFKDDDAEVLLGRGDVKYHLGRSTDVVTRSGNPVHLSLCFNPSHLEFVDPVVLGRVRAKQERFGDETGDQCLPLLIHGDAAVIGQGVVAETLNMSQLRGYKVGGTVHIVANNQIGFTTDPSDSRSTRYCTDIAKMLEVPVLHVNAEDLDAVTYAAELAIAYRQRFKRDIFIDLISYRRHGHNEGDEPRFTQPRMYNVIDDKKTIREMYRDRLIAKGSLTAEQDEAIVSAWTNKMEQSLEASADNAHPTVSAGGGLWSDYKGGLDDKVEKVATGVDRERLLTILDKVTTPPEGFNVHSKLQRLFLNARKKMADGDQPLDWATGEMLAFGTLLGEGVSIRMSGQDSQRGTFSQRHAVITDTQSGEKWTPLDAVSASPGLFQVWNSPLSEAGVVGFEYGYSLDTPDGLTIWEAQFGDFVNGAQVFLDQFITSGEDKWDRLSGLVLMLPHGFEGQGPEHSSARMERFLMQCSEDNIQVCNLTTPAQIFHVLRRQVLRPLRKPLIVMSPKSLLRHKMAVSDLNELVNGSFQRIIPDQSGVAPAEINRVLMCSGRIYYDLVAERDERGMSDVAIIRFEQLYPLSASDIREALEPYSHASLHWVQDEPWNMGAWLYMQARLRETLGRTQLIRRVSRAGSASPATGSRASHNLEQKLLMDMAFGKLEHDRYGAVADGAI